LPFDAAYVSAGSNSEGPGAQLGSPLYPQEQTSRAGPAGYEKCQQATLQAWF
jgi:hypothetical protein